MIVDSPSADDFRNGGIDLLGLSWDITIGLLLDLDLAKLDESDQEMVDDFWIAAQRHLATAVSLAMQGTEFLLKSRICRVSPYLLLGPHSAWPRGCDSENTPFSDFKTIDAQDLVKVHDVTAREKLSPEFVERFTELRKRRNRLTHSLDKRANLAAKDIFIDILAVSEELIGPAKWPEIREDCLERSPTSAAHSSDHVSESMYWEFARVLQMLEAKEAKRYFSFDKKSRAYLCPECLHKVEMAKPVKTAVLRPTGASATSIYCFICRKTTEVVRSECSSDACKGNVIWKEGETCLSCLRNIR
jgi:hypothetical protein